LIFNFAKNLDSTDQMKALEATAIAKEAVKKSNIQFVK
jgi:hypothetical protein